MTSSRSVFYGFGAWVGSVRNATVCAFWSEDPSGAVINWDRAKMVQVDLDRNPYAVRAGRIPVDKIHVDDRPSDGALTKIGPTFPGGSNLNGVWLESEFWDKLPNKPSRQLSYAQCRPYELTTVTYWSGPLQDRRFWGFHAEITSVQGSNAMCTIWQAGKSQQPNVPVAGSWWIDLAVSGHPIEQGFTEIGVGAADARVGALFLDAALVASLGLRGPKLPPTAGFGSYPRAKRT